MFWSEARAGFRDILPAQIAALPIAALFGALAAGRGMPVPEVGLMSALVFAGSAQFAALEIWTQPAPIAILAFSTFLMNARHILMSASLAPKTTAFKVWQRWLGFFALVDEGWAMAERRAALTRLTPAYFFGMMGPFWLSWVVCTTIGAQAGALLGEPRALGADFAFSALFIGLIAGFWKGRATGITIAAAGGSAAIAYLLFGAPWHVAIGAVAGVAAAYLAAPAGDS